MAHLKALLEILHEEFDQVSEFPWGKFLVNTILSGGICISMGSKSIRRCHIFSLEIDK